MLTLNTYQEHFRNVMRKDYSLQSFKFADRLMDLAPAIRQGNRSENILKEHGLIKKDGTIQNPDIYYTNSPKNKALNWVRQNFHKYILDLAVDKLTKEQQKSDKTIVNALLTKWVVYGEADELTFFEVTDKTNIYDTLKNSYNIDANKVLFDNEFEVINLNSIWKQSLATIKGLG